VTGSPDVTTAEDASRLTLHLSCRGLCPGRADGLGSDGDGVPLGGGVGLDSPSELDSDLEDRGGSAELAWRCCSGADDAAVASNPLASSEIGRARRSRRSRVGMWS
jgi:hypothetical protein